MNPTDVHGWFQDSMAFGERLGFPALVLTACLVFAGFVTWRVLKFLAPYVATWFEKHFTLIDNLIEKLTGQDHKVTAVAERVDSIGDDVGEIKQGVERIEGHLSTGGK